MPELTHTPIDTTAMLARAQSATAGAVVLFVGVTREFTGDRQTQQLDYEAYAEMALAELGRLEAEATERWGLAACEVIHRLGRVPLAEASVAVVAASPHRSEAFEAARWLIDTLKEQAPIWKRETYADGATEWLHPDPSAAASGGEP
ncbi:Molybdopterin synthase catalytic subunit [Pseudobythopirellula maris]|uniref:Molybdopterin synthase catalytic subunit n=1 Tax=Pseudobythopirellula maris TaxID=2527991 RepID=A0A5C5ZU95_9BACT|nr:molybdenum cofactor biosynthesis protein MoaE [Pseudobythopirellula maris]TWT90461.1 Molybdopterin synthase catalytic subunit [Pseudobythopirellula maris]